jgi:hypothetical protein
MVSQNTPHSSHASPFLSFVETALMNDCTGIKTGRIVLLWSNLVRLLELAQSGQDGGLEIQQHRLLGGEHGRRETQLHT